MLTLALILAALAGALHLYIFWMESFAWQTPRVRATFKTTEEEARATRSLAFIQGFYNLFLAVVAVIGIVMLAVDADSAGWMLVAVGCGSMVAAALVLVVNDRSYASAAAKQGVIPALALIALALA